MLRLNVGMGSLLSKKKKEKTKNAGMIFVGKFFLFFSFFKGKLEYFLVLLLVSFLLRLWYM